MASGVGIHGGNTGSLYPTLSAEPVSADSSNALKIYIEAILADAARPRSPHFVTNIGDSLPYEHRAKFETLLKDARSYAISPQALNPFAVFAGQLIAPPRLSKEAGFKPFRIYMDECLAIAEQSIEVAKCCTVLTSDDSTHPYKNSFSHELRMAFYKAILDSLKADCVKTFKEEPCSHPRSLPAFLEMFRGAVEPRLKSFVKRDAPIGFNDVEPLRELLQESQLATPEISALMKTSPKEGLKQLLRFFRHDLHRLRAEYIQAWKVMKESGLEAFDANVHEVLFAIELRWQGRLEIYKILGGDPLHNKSLGEAPTALRILLAELAPQRPLVVKRSLDRAAWLIFETALHLDDLAVISAGQMMGFIKPCISAANESMTDESIHLRSRFQCLQATHSIQVSKMSLMRNKLVKCI